MRALHLRQFQRVGPSAGRLLLLAAGTLFFLLAEAVIARKFRWFRGVGFFALSESRFQFSDPRFQLLDLFGLPTHDIQQIVNLLITFAKFLLQIPHARMCIAKPHILPRSVRRMGNYLEEMDHADTELEGSTQSLRNHLRRPFSSTSRLSIDTNIWTGSDSGTTSFFLQ